MTYIFAREIVLVISIWKGLANFYCQRKENKIIKIYKSSLN